MNELTIALNMESKIPMYEQIYQYVKQEIQSGQFRAGEKLPSARKLCRFLDISRSTVDLAYEQLQSEGYIESKPRSGYYVLEIDELYQYTNPTIEYKGDIQKLVKEKHLPYDFSPYGVDIKNFPYGVWKKISKQLLSDENKGMFRLGDSKGELGLRTILCDYLHQSRGIHCRPEQIVIGAGNDYMLMLLCMILNTHQSIVFENPTYKQAYRIFQNQGFDVKTVHLDEKGMKIDELKRSASDIAYVMPSHQYPTGVVMSVKRRQELLRWANEDSSRYIIEDDYDSEFRYKGKPIPALQGMDLYGKVIYLGTFSKAIAPSIRMSYMVLPEQLLHLYDERCSFLSSTVSKVDQNIVESFMKEGYFERHLNKSRAMYKGRHDKLLILLRPLVESGHCSISGEYAGVHILLHFQNEREDELIKRAEQYCVKVYGMSDYVVDESKQSYDGATIILGYANMREEEIEEAVSRLILAWN